MLVLSRKESERIRVGDSIVVTVVRLTKDRVRLGIEAPDDVLVLRDELEKESESVAVPEMKVQPIAKVTPGMGPLARKMSSLASRKEFAGCAVALEEKPIQEEESETSASRVRRCPERKFFRCD